MKISKVFATVILIAFGMLASMAHGQGTDLRSMPLSEVNLEMLLTFFGWMSAINFGVLMLLTLILTFGRKLVYPIINFFFPMSEEAFNISFFAITQFTKGLWWFFNVCPFIALAIVSGMW